MEEERPWALAIFEHDDNEFTTQKESMKKLLEAELESKHNLNRDKIIAKWDDNGKMEKKLHRQLKSLRK